LSLSVHPKGLTSNCLGAREKLMEEGYRAMGELDRALAEADMGAGAESIPEW
jgi:hypothetical protein